MELAERTDEQLIAQAARESSDGLAFAELLARHEARVWRICYRLLGNEADATDAAQEVFVRLFFQRDRFAGRAQFTTWLHGIAVRTCLSMARAHGRRQRRERGIAESAARQQAGDANRKPAGPTADVAIDLETMLATLGPKDRALMVMKYAEGHTFEELAEMFEMTVSACKMRVARCKERLHERFAGEESG
ncbi:MAG: sigma-70 family RNA polymerase sigma factor [Pirellulales bacterium]